MTTASNNKPAEGNRENIEAARDEALIKRIETAIYATEGRKKALDVLCKRIASRDVSSEMLLRILASLSKH